MPDPSIADLVPPPNGGSEQRIVLYSGRVATDPATPEDRVYVTIDAFDGGVHRHGPCPWSPRIVDADEYGIPTRGDLALVALTEEGEPWIVEWWPYE